MPQLRSRNAARTAGASSGGSAVSLGVIITVVVIGTIFLAVGGGLLCAWVARRKRHRRRQKRHLEEEENRKKQMMFVTMMRDSDEGGQPAEPVSDAAVAAASTAAAAAANSYFRSGGPISDCASSTCCSLASSRGTFSTTASDFEGSGMTWWWLWRWRRFWHSQRHWVRRQKQRVVPAVLRRTGSNNNSSSSGDAQGNGLKLQSQHNRCQHDHGHHGHHHHRRGTVDGSPRKLRRRRPETSIISSTNSLFFPTFVGENDNNDNANVSNAANSNIGLRPPAPTFSIVRANSFPQRPPPPSEQQRLLPPHGSSLNGGGKMGGPNGPWANRRSMPNVPPRPQNSRYRPQPQMQRQQQEQQKQGQQGPSLQPLPPISTRSLPHPPRPALIIPNQPETFIPPGVPFYPNMASQQHHQMMVMMMQQQQMHLQQQIQQQHHQQQQQQQQQLLQQQQRQSRPGNKLAPQSLATDSALTEILRSTEQRLTHLQSQQPGNLGSLKRSSTTGAKTTASANNAPAVDGDSESIKRVSQASGGSDADSMFVSDSQNNNNGSCSNQALDSSPILDAITTALSSPSKSPNKNRVAAGTLAAAGSNIMAHPMMLPAPTMLLPQPAPSMSMSLSSPETRSPSSVYSSSGTSSRSSLSTVYSADERSEKGTVMSKATAKGGVWIASSDDDAHNDRILAGLGITGSGTESQFVDAKKLEKVQVTVADTNLIPAALSTNKSRAARGMSAVGPGMNNTAVPDLPLRSPKRSAGATSSTVKGSGIMITHSTSGNTLSNSSNNTNNNVSNRSGSGSGRNRYRHRRSGSVCQQVPSPQHQQQQYSNGMMMNNGIRLSFGGPSIQGGGSGVGGRPSSGHFVTTMGVNMAPPAVRVLVTSPSKPVNNVNRVSAAELSDKKMPTSTTSMTTSSSSVAWRNSMVAASLLSAASSAASSPSRDRAGADRSVLPSSPTLAPEDEHFLVPGRPNPRTSWGAQPPSPPKHGRRSLNERIEALQAVEMEEVLFRRSVRPLPRPPSFGTINNMKNNNTVVAAAAELRRMNSTAYSEASSCYSNATSAIGKSPAPGSVPAMPLISTAPSAMGLAQPRRAARRRNSSAGETASGVANRNSVVGSRHYLALGKKRLSQVGNSNGAGGGYDKENRGAIAKRSSAPPASSRPAPQRTRSTRSMTTTGTALRRVDENPASGSPTPSGTPNRGVVEASSSTWSGSFSNPSTPKANTGRPLRKSPSRATQVGAVSMMHTPGSMTMTPSAAGSPTGKLRTKSMMGPSTPTRGATTQRQPTSRDSLGLYDQDGFLLSSPARKL